VVVARARLGLGGLAAGGVGVAESGGPEVVAAGEGLVGPSGLVSDPVVVTAPRRQVLHRGRSVLAVGDAMVEVTAGGGRPAAGEHTCRVAGFDFAALRVGGSPPGGAVVNRLTGVGVGDGDPPLGVALFGDLAGDVGDDGAVSAQLAGGFREPAQGCEVDSDVDDTPTGGLGVPGAFEDVQEYVGAELIHGAGLSCGP